MGVAGLIETLGHWGQWQTPLNVDPAPLPLPPSTHSSHRSSHHLSTEMRNSSSSTRPALAVELVTLIVGFTQHLEDDTPVKLPASESPSATLARVRRLLEKGLVSKAWHDAIMAPSLWTTFLNIGMSEEQFLIVLELVKELPAGIWLGGRPFAEGNGNVQTPT
ncbi:hypothetical protein FA13DRAFT_1843919, partial [Coprinellus micaceus]